MQYPQRFMCLDDGLPEDELDHLFNRLQQVEPPQALVERILTSISQISQHMPPMSSSPWDKLDGLVVRNESCGAS